MKQKLKTVVLLLAALACLVLLYRHFFPNDEKIIRRRLAELAEAASIPEQSSPAAGLVAADRLRDFLTPQVEVVVELPHEGRHTFAGRQELVQAALAARATYGGLKVEFLDVRVTVDPGRATATAHLTARATLPAQRDFMVQELSLRLQKEERQWRVLRAETVKTLSL